MNEKFEMVAKTLQGLEEVLAEELRGLGAENVEPGRRMVSFEGDLEILYKANLCCRTALRILKPIHKFTASDPDELYESVKEFDWSTVLSVDKSFCIDTVAFGEEFTHSQFVTYRVKDAIVDWFRDRLGDNKRPGVRVQDADVVLNVHVAGKNVTISLDSSGKSLHQRGYRVAQNDAPINEVLAAGIILRSGWRGECPLVDPMCGSGTFLIEAALIAANINPGIYRSSFAFEKWPDFDADLFDSIYNDDSQEREFEFKIYGADIDPKAIAITRQNIKSAGVGKYIELECKGIDEWDEAAPNGVLVTNPPYGERISVENMEGLYETLGSKLKNVFKGYHAWIISSKNEYFDAIHLSPSTKINLLNGSIECELREYIIFEGDYKSFRSQGGKIHFGEEQTEASADKYGVSDRTFSRKDEKRDRKSFGDRKGFGDRRERQSDRFDRESRGFTKKFDRENRSSAKKFDRDDRKFSKSFGRDDRKFAKKFDREDRKFGDSFDRRDNYASENPLAKRRNPQALKSITGKQPSLARPNTVMRPRKGWKKPGEGEA